MKKFLTDYLRCVSNPSTFSDLFYDSIHLQTNLIPSDLTNFVPPLASSGSYVNEVHFQFSHNIMSTSFSWQQQHLSFNLISLL